METEGLTKDTKKKQSDGGKKRKLEIKEVEISRKDLVMSFRKEGMVRTKGYRRPSEIRTEKGSFNLAIMRSLEIQAGIMR